jgi:hypothetical protein
MLDEDLEGVIKMEDFNNTLEAYNLSGERHQEENMLTFEH